MELIAVSNWGYQKEKLQQQLSARERPHGERGAYAINDRKSSVFGKTTSAPAAMAIP